MGMVIWQAGNVGDSELVLCCSGTAVPLCAVSSVTGMSKDMDDSGQDTRCPWHNLPCTMVEALLDRSGPSDPILGPCSWQHPLLICGRYTI